MNIRVWGKLLIILIQKCFSSDILCNIHRRFFFVELGLHCYEVNGGGLAAVPFYIFENANIREEIEAVVLTCTIIPWEQFYFRYPTHVIPNSYTFSEVGYHAFLLHPSALFLHPFCTPYIFTNVFEFLTTFSFLSFTFFPQFYFEYFVRCIFFFIYPFHFFVFYQLDFFSLSFNFSATYTRKFFFFSFVKRIKRFECTEKFCHQVFNVFLGVQHIVLRGFQKKRKCKKKTQNFLILSHYRDFFSYGERGPRN